jgi:predicted kinase
VPLIYLICGSTGAGKTTYARKLADELGAVRFSIDEWMAALFWMDTPQPIAAAWAMERVERCNAQIWRTATELASRGIAVVLDLGFSTTEQRGRVVDLAAAQGLSAQLHFLDVPAEERWRRVQERNCAGAEANQLPFAVTRDMFDFVETLFEVPSEDELRANEGVHITG